MSEVCDNNNISIIPAEVEEKQTSKQTMTAMDGINRPPSLPVEEAPEDISEEEGAEQEREEVEGEAEFLPHVDRYIQNLHDNHLFGSGYYDQRLEHFHEAISLTTKNLYYAKPRPRECIERVDETPSDHPLRAIAAVLESAPDNSIVRITAYSLTDMLAINLLSHHGGSKTIRVLLHRSTETRKALAKWVTEIGNKRALLENVEIRLVAMSTFGATSFKASLHAKSVITDAYTVIGSYNLSNLARAGNFEVITVTPTQQESITTFDEMWDNDLVLTNQAERIYGELNYPAPEGSKRKARYDAVNAEISSRKRAKAAEAQSCRQALHL